MPRFIGCGCITMASGLASARRSGVKPVTGEIAIAVGQRRLRHALLLNAQHHDDVRILEPVSAVRSAAQPANSCGLGHERGGRDDAQIRHAECAERRGMPSARRANGGCRRRWRCVKLVEARLVLPHRQRIEQPLRRMGQMCASPADSTLTCGATWAATSAEHAGLGFADHEHVDVQRLERVDGVEHALALGARGQLHLEVDDLGARDAWRRARRRRACASRAR